jgi:transposase InsO family protein
VLQPPEESAQFRSHVFTGERTECGLRGSIGRIGVGGDSAAMESFFALLQKNVLNKTRRDTRDDLRLETVYWVEGTYHQRRRKAALGKLAPIKFEESASQL